MAGPLTHVRKRVPDPLKAPARIALAAYARRRLNDRAAHATSVSDNVALAFDFACGPLSIEPHQVRSEITRLLERLAAQPPKAVLEIGTALGGTLFLLTRVAADDATLVSVDMPKGTGFAAVNATRGSFYRSFARESQRLEFVRGDSHSPQTRTEVERLFDGRQVDLLFIDGDHSAEGVRADFRDYADLVAPGGTIAFHDIVPGGEARTGGVPQFWQELRASHPAEVEEIVEDWNQSGLGIGLLRASASTSKA